VALAEERQAQELERLAVVLKVVRVLQLVVETLHQVQPGLVPA
jgi:hypothetical protein